MLSDMLRIMLSKQASALFAAAQPGIGDFFKNIGFGPASKTPGIPVMDAGITSMTGNIGANGLIYGSSGRIDKFAQGGSFTNSIVNSPTLFKFAKGTGLMGEAGPEAIMPLKRDSNGTLGVRAGGGNTTAVVVNNYGTAPATTKETVDSKGNRKIEVIIGDIVAGELSRAGSPTQQAMGTNFGARPTVLRR
jgi:phage-related minor tail protein